MKSDQVNLENTDTAKEKFVGCTQFGWPGTGKLPAGVRVLKRDGKNALVGQLSYYRASVALCSVCQTMQSAVASRQWFVDAHAEYLDQVEMKNQMLGGS